MDVKIYGCKIFFDYKPPRVGPSASQAPQQPNPDQLADVVKAISLLQSVMQQPWAQQVFANASPVSGEHVDAAAGKPASSKPAQSMSSVAAAVLTPTPAPKAAPAPPAVPPPKPVTPPSEPSAPAAAPPANPPTAPVVSPPHTTSSETSTPPGDKTSVAPANAGIINSATHRASHARLARRMSSLDPAECPHMQQLWAGSRKD